MSPVNSVPEAVRSEQVLANGYVQQYQHPNYGPVAAAALPIKSTVDPADRVRRVGKIRWKCSASSVSLRLNRSQNCTRKK